jgi:hypothetical protein
MAGQFYVAEGYWDWGYSDPQPAGVGSGMRRRNRVRLHGQEWDVTDLELEYILSRMVQEPEVLQLVPRKARKRILAAPKTVTVPPSYQPEQPLVRFNSANFVMLRSEAERNADATILAALERLLYLREEDDEEVMLVLM